ncbi:3,4-dihydroxy-2-butanone 4-phosphate synthase [Pisolithus sp. B1]|nr:3,4-dihydroxy-2-butanone 4-phosphate synthase [Pisolithus sp. B1]
MAHTNGSNISHPWYPSRAKNQTTRASFEFDSVEDALAAFARGEPIIVMDDEDRENEGDIIMSASMCTTEAMAWIIKHTSGFVCIALPQQRLDELEIPMMVTNNNERYRTAYALTVDYKHGTTTGISASDRSLTARKLVDKRATASDFARPGHMVPLRACDGGVFIRRGHTECSVDLCMLTGHPAGGVLCELVNDDVKGTMARRDECRAFADLWGLKMISVEMVVNYRKFVANMPVNLQNT